jgi:hypothetical protein
MMNMQNSISKYWFDEKRILIRSFFKSLHIDVSFRHLPLHDVWIECQGFWLHMRLNTVNRTHDYIIKNFLDL